MCNLVQCRSDSAYAERPVALHWQGERLEVVEILARWRSPEGVGFRVIVGGGQVFELFYLETDSAWVVTLKN